MIKEAKRYVDAKIAKTNCMQKHFRQLCNKCKKYNRCSIYNEYVDAWMELQKLAKVWDMSRLKCRTAFGTLALKANESWFQCLRCNKIFEDHRWEIYNYKVKCPSCGSKKVKHTAPAGNIA